MMKITKAVVTSRGKSDYSFLNEGKGTEALMLFPEINTTSRNFGIIKLTDNDKTSGEKIELTKAAYAKDYAIDDIRQYNERAEEVPIPYEALGEGLTLLADTLPELKKFDITAQKVLASILFELSAQGLDGNTGNTVYLDVKRLQHIFGDIKKAEQVRAIIKEGLDRLDSVHFYYKETDSRGTFKMKSRILQASGSSLSHGLYKVKIADDFLSFLNNGGNTHKAFFPHRALAYANRITSNQYRVLTKLFYNFRRNQHNGIRRNHTISVRELYECTTLPTVEEVRASKGGNIAQRTISALVNILCTLTDNGDLNYWYFSDEYGTELSTVSVERKKAEQWIRLNVYYELNGYPEIEQNKKKKEEEQHDN